MSTVNFPSSMNLSEGKQSAITSANASFQRIRSDNASYTDNDIIRIEIPTGRAGDFLHGSDSFISGKFKPEFTNTAGYVSIDSCIYSIIKSIKIYHGSNLIDSVDNANRLYNAIYDLQVHNSERHGDTINMMISDNVQNKLAGYFGQILTSGVEYDFSFTLPCALLGSLSEKALPLGWMGSSSIYVEITLESANRVLTTQEQDTNELRGRIGQCSALSVTKYTVSEIYYNAQITQIGSQYNNILLQAFAGKPIVIPSVSWRGEQKTMSAASTSFSDKFSFQLSSVKMLLWWLTNSTTANGDVSGANLGRAISQRQCARLSEWNISLNGTNFPSQPIKAGDAGTGVQYMANVYSHLLRAFNMNSSIEKGGILCKTNYCDSLTTGASEGLCKRSIMGISLDRFDQEGEKYMQGHNTVGQNLVLDIKFNAAHSNPQNVYAYVQYDCAYELVDGLLTVQN
jgi:hypothetical protein